MKIPVVIEFMDYPVVVLLRDDLYTAMRTGYDGEELLRISNHGNFLKSKVETLKNGNPNDGVLNNFVYIHYFNQYYWE